MSSGKASLEQLAKIVASPALPPVHEWHPSHTRDVDIRIARNGDWFFEGSLIQRERMVGLFSTVLRVDDGQTYLVTPQERLRIQVDDAPFTAVLLERTIRRDVQELIFTTNVGEHVRANADHLITVSYSVPGGEPSPYLRVRDQLRALISRSVFMQLAEFIEERQGVLGIMSSNCFMPMSDPSEAVN